MKVAFDLLIVGPQFLDPEKIHSVRSRIRLKSVRGADRRVVRRALT